jgi:hypothetical protein
MISACYEGRPKSRGRVRVQNASRPSTIVSQDFSDRATNGAGTIALVDAREYDDPQRTIDLFQEKTLHQLQTLGTHLRIKT